MFTVTTVLKTVSRSAQEYKKTVQKTKTVLVLVASPVFILIIKKKKKQKREKVWKK